MKKSSSKEILITLNAMYELLTAENRADRIKSLERSLELAFGRIEDLEKRNHELEKHLKVEFINKSNYQKK